MNTAPPIVSVIVLTYNQAQTIGQTLDSILAQQTDFPYEIVIGEDASTDGTRRVCETYADRYPETIRLMPAAPNKGVACNYFDALRACRGRYIACCAGDDWWCDPNKLCRQVEFLDAHPDYVLTHAEMKRLDAATDVLVEPPMRSDVPDGDVRKELFLRYFVAAPTVCYRASATREIDFESIMALNPKMEDVPMWIELAQHGKFHYMPFYAVTYRVGQESACSTNSYTKRVAFIDSVYRCLEYYIRKYPNGLSLRTIRTHYSAERIDAAMECRQPGALFRDMFCFGPWAVLKRVARKLKRRK